MSEPKVRKNRRTEISHQEQEWPANDNAERAVKIVPSPPSRKNPNGKEGQPTGWRHPEHAYALHELQTHTVEKSNKFHVNRNS